MEWLDLAQDRDKWRSLVSTVKTVRFVQNVGNVLIRLGNIGFLRVALMNETSLFVCLFVCLFISQFVT